MLVGKYVLSCFASAFSINDLISKIKSCKLLRSSMIKQFLKVLPNLTKCLRGAVCNNLKTISTSQSTSLGHVRVQTNTAYLRIGSFATMASSEAACSSSGLANELTQSSVDSSQKGGDSDVQADSTSHIAPPHSGSPHEQSTSRSIDGDIVAPSGGDLSTSERKSDDLSLNKKRSVEECEADSCTDNKKLKLSSADKADKPDQGNTADSTSNVSMATDDRGNTSHIKRKKVAMLMVYSGTGYNGMQRNPPYPTIEEELLTALRTIGAITEEHYSTPQKMQFQRAARTDKGVSALGQVVSLQLPVNHDRMVQKINELLPQQIRVLGLVRATKGFNSKNNCMSRTYSYVCPTFAFAPLEENTTEDYRVSDKVIAEVNSILSMYKGTHNFHNFTSGRKPDDKSAVRYLMDLKCSPVYVTDGIEFTVIQVKGQSFMLHQIRKMIGLMIAIVRGLGSRDLIKQAWQPEKCDIPIAPALGLMLEQLHYDAYNKRFGNDGIHDPIRWDEYKDDIEAFKHKYIYPNIVWKEKQEKSMMTWLGTLLNHTFGVIRGDDETGVGLAGRNVYLLNQQLIDEQNRKQDKQSPKIDPNDQVVKEDQTNGNTSENSSKSETDVSPGGSL